MSGAVCGGAVVAALLAAAVGAFTTNAVKVTVAAVAIVAVAAVTLRQPDRQWGWRRQVNRRSSFGVTAARPLLFLWGAELGSGIGTVITQSATIVFLTIAAICPVWLAAVGGAGYGAARMARTWQPRQATTDDNFSSPMTRYGAAQRSAAVVNAITVSSSAVGLVVLAAVSLS